MRLLSEFTNLRCKSGKQAKISNVNDGFETAITPRRTRETLREHTLYTANNGHEPKKHTAPRQTSQTGRRVNDITRETAGDFVADRRKAGKSNSTINNSVRLLIRMFSLARDNGKLTAVPKFELLRTKSRQDFLPPEQFQKLLDALPTNLQPMLLLLYHSGVHVGEAERIEWTAVDLDAARITRL